jgi:hypothetical protein
VQKLELVSLLLESQTDKFISLSLSLSLSLLFTEACLFSLLFYGITFGPAKIMQAKV